MKLISNTKVSNHKDTLIELIDWAEEMTLCSGWADKNGLLLLKPSIVDAMKRGATVELITSGKHSKRGTKEIFRKLTDIYHRITSKEKRFLHSKIYLFENDGFYRLIIGSANMMLTGLTSNEELSVLLEGNVGDTIFIEAKEYISRIKEELLD